MSYEIDGIKQFIDICKDYVNLGYSWSGKIKLHGTKRILCGRLPMKKTLIVLLNLNMIKMYSKI